MNESATCRRTRLAECALGAVDYCECNAMQLHLGAFTLRLSTEVAEALVRMLGEALIRHAAWEASTTRTLPGSIPARQKGEA